MTQQVTRSQRLALQGLALAALLYQVGSALLEARQGHTVEVYVNLLGAALCGASFWYQRRYGFHPAQLASWVIPLVCVWLVVQVWGTSLQAELPGGVFATQTMLVLLAFSLLSSRLAILLGATSYLVVVIAAALHAVVRWQALLDQAFLNCLIGGMAYVSSQVLNAHSRANYYSALARRDPLTGLANRYEARLAFEDWRRQGRMTPLEQGAVILLDLDHFKRVNDQYGHVVGDRALQMVADVLRRNVRKDDLACRWGGEEFLVVLRGVERGTALRRTQQILREVEAAREPGVPALTISAGLASLSEFTDEVEFMALVDERLYAAKRAGRNTVVQQ